MIGKRTGFQWARSNRATDDGLGKPNLRHVLARRGWFNCELKHSMVIMHEVDNLMRCGQSDARNHRSTLAARNQSFIDGKVKSNPSDAKMAS